MRGQRVCKAPQSVLQPLEIKNRPGSSLKNFLNPTHFTHKQTKKENLTSVNSRRDSASGQEAPFDINQGYPHDAVSSLGGLNGSGSARQSCRLSPGLGNPTSEGLFQVYDTQKESPRFSLHKASGLGLPSDPQVLSNT